MILTSGHGPGSRACLPARVRATDSSKRWHAGSQHSEVAYGPDEVHKVLIAKNVLSQYHRGAGWDFGN